jgi:DNA-binding MarR family transcriptional regulator
MVSRAEASQEIVRLLPAVAMDLRLATLFDLEAADLTANQVLTLMLVSSAPDGRMKAGEIARRLEISLPAATALVDRLVSAGVFERSQGKDRRVVWVSVTEAGQGMWGRLWAGLESRVYASIDGIGPASLDALVEAVRRVASFADQIGARDTSRSNAPSSALATLHELPP